MPVIHGLPVPEPLWQIAPRAPHGLTNAQAALAAVERRGQASLHATAVAEELSECWITNAALVLQHAPDLTDRVNSGELPLFTAAQIARLRRDAPDLAARC